MPRAKRLIHGTVTIDDCPLVWHLHREEQRLPDQDWRGIAIHVKHAELTRKELILEYPTTVPPQVGWVRMEPPRPAITAAKVEGHIREAVADGWNPESRGKPYVYHVQELPS